MEEQNLEIRYQKMGNEARKSGDFSTEDGENWGVDQWTVGVDMI